MAIALKKILCPIDFSTPSDDALAYACELAQRVRGELHLVHVFQNPAYALPMSGNIGPQAELIFKLRASCEDLLEQARSGVEKAGVPAQADLLEGVAHQEILGFAKQVDAGLIVTGTHGRTGLSHALLGSVAERLVRLADRPVLVVPSRRTTTKT